jgi:6-phosphofructokinase 1
MAYAPGESDLVTTFTKVGARFWGLQGPQDVVEMADTLERMNVGSSSVSTGDGTLRGAQAISEEIGRRGSKSVYRHSKND